MKKEIIRNTILALVSFSLFLSCKDINEFFREAPKVEYVNSLVLNFGLIKKKDSIQHTFLIKNLSKTDLIINDVESDCECTVVSFTKERIKENKLAKIKILYHPKNIGKVKKELLVVANTKPRFTIFTLKGEVVK